MKKNAILLMLLFSIVACKKNETPKLWTVSGEVQMQDAQSASIITPLAGIKVYLLKAPFTMDTLTRWFTKTDILDSVITDANGLYRYSQLQPGDYVVMATDTMAGYRFDWSKSPDPVGFTIENVQKEYTVNFTTPEPIMENSESFIFSFNHSGDNNLFKYIKISQNCRVRFGCGSWWSEPCEWYWDQKGKDQNFYDLDYTFTKSSENDSIYTVPFSHPSFSISKNATTFIYEYDNVFQIKFYTAAIDQIFYGGLVLFNNVYTLNISGNDLRDQNVYNVIWHLDSVEVTRTN